MKKYLVVVEDMILRNRSEYDLDQSDEIALIYFTSTLLEQAYFHSLGFRQVILVFCDINDRVEILLTLNHLINEINIDRNDIECGTDDMQEAYNKLNEILSVKAKYKVPIDFNLN